MVNKTYKTDYDIITGREIVKVFYLKEFYPNLSKQVENGFGKMGEIFKCGKKYGEGKPFSVKEEWRWFINEYLLFWVLSFEMINYNKEKWKRR